MKRILATVVALLSLGLTLAASADALTIPVPGPGPIYPTAVEGTVKVTHFYCIALVGVDCPPTRVDLVQEDGTMLSITGPLAHDLESFDGKDMTLKGIRYGVPTPGGPEALDVESFTLGHGKGDFVTGTIHVSNNRNFPPDVYIEVGGRMMYIDNAYARTRLAQADGAVVTFEGVQTGLNRFRPTRNTFMVKGRVRALPQPLCFPGGPCGPFPTHAIDLPNGGHINIDATGIHEDDRYMGRGETRWFELELDPNKPELLKAKSYSDVVYPQPVIEPWPPWVGPIVPLDDAGNNAHRLADTQGGSTSGQSSSPDYIEMKGMARD